MNENKKKQVKLIVGVVLFVVIFATLFSLASVFDLEISHKVASPYLSNEPGTHSSYYATNGFGMYFEVLGSTPIYIMLSLAGAIAFWYGRHNKKNWLTPIGMILSFVGIYLVFSDVFNYLSEHLEKEEEMKQFYITCITLTLSVVTDVLLLISWGRISKKTNDRLLSWAFMIIVTLALYLVVHFIKGPIGRARYRTMNYLNDFSYYTPWYVANGKRDLITIVSDSCKSFPSGHTFSAGMIYNLLALPYLVSCMNKKWVKALLYTLTIAFTGAVGFSRIIIGAHYMSDVTFSGTLIFIGVMITREIFVCKGSNIKALLGKPYQEVTFDDEDNDEE